MKLSVNVITYNHARFIGQTLDTVLSQKCDFDFEIIVGDDCSTDGTTEIVKDYYRRFPEKIKPLFRARNVGAGANARQTLEMCRGEYIACVEGDDYWTDPDKIRLQVEYLDKHRDCALVHHPVTHIAWPGGETLAEYPPARYRVERPDTRALAMINFLQACSLMFRRECMPPLGDGFQELKLGDWPLCVLLSQRGWIGYIDRCMAHYRVHPSNTWKHRPADYKLRAMEQMARYLLERVDEASKDLWKDTLLALAFKDFALAARSFSFIRASKKLGAFAARSAQFRRPFWLLNRLWPYYQANYLANTPPKAEAPSAEKTVSSTPFRPREAH